MDFTTLPGLAPFVDPIALAIVGGGTAGAVVLRSPLADLGRSVAALPVLFRNRFDAEPLLAQVRSLTRIARRHGVIALDRSVIKDPDIAAATAAIVDCASADEVRALLAHRRLARFERHSAAAGVWASAAELAPAMGMIGTLVGLIAMFTAMRDPTTIGTGMAVALLTTLYGAIVANLIASPIATRLRQRARHEAQERARLEGPLALIAEIEPAVPRDLEAAA